MAIRKEGERKRRKPRNADFGRMLRACFVYVATRRGVRVGDIHRELAGTVNYSAHTIQRWCKGYVPADHKTVEALVRYLAKNHCHHKELAELLTKATYPQPDSFLLEVLPRDEVLFEPTVAPAGGLSLSCSLADLLWAARLAARVTPRDARLRPLKYILIESVDEGVRLVGNNLEMTAELVVSAEVRRAGAVAVPVSRLLRSLGKLPGERLSLEVKGEGPGFSTRFSSNAAAVEIPGIPADAYPRFPGQVARFVLTTEAAKIRSLISRTVFAVDPDASRRMPLSGVLFEAEGRELRLVATDGTRLAISIAALAHPVRRKLSAIVSHHLLRTLSRLLDELSGTLSIQVSDAALVFAFPTVRLSCRLMAGLYPNYRQVVPDYSPPGVGTKRRIRMNARSFRAAVKRAWRRTFDSANVIALQASGSSLTIESVTSDWRVERVPAEIEGEPIRLGFNASHLHEGLTAIDTREVVLELFHPLAPAVVRPSARNDYIYVMAPVRLFEKPQELPSEEADSEGLYAAASQLLQSEEAGPDVEIDFDESGNPTVAVSADNWWQEWLVSGKLEDAIRMLLHLPSRDLRERLSEAFLRQVRLRWAHEFNTLAERVRVFCSDAFNHPLADRPGREFAFPGSMPAPLKGAQVFLIYTAGRRGSSDEVWGASFAGDFPAWLLWHGSKYPTETMIFAGLLKFDRTTLRVLADKVKQASSEYWEEFREYEDENREALLDDNEQIPDDVDAPPDDSTPF